MIKELIDIQAELKAPKSNYNEFGNYNYRSAEDILEAVKPLCKKYKCQLTISDQIVQIGDRYYVCATALIENESGEKHYVEAWARETESKKGSDPAQITGATSSYARKYALNGLFLIDDTKDADTNERHRESENRAKKDNFSEELSNTISKQQAQVLVKFAESHGFNGSSKEIGEQLCKHFGVESLSEVTVEQQTKFFKEHESTEQTTLEV